MEMKITKEVVDRVEQIMRILHVDKISSDPLTGAHTRDLTRFIAQMQATSLIREDIAVGIFKHPAIRNFCLYGEIEEVEE